MMEQDRFWPISEDTQQRAQFWDCMICRAVVIDRRGHLLWHEQHLAAHIGSPADQPDDETGWR